MKVKVDELKKISKKAILSYGYNEDEASAILEVLMYAQLRGNNQGVVKLIGPGIPKAPDVAEIEIEKETKLSAVLNAHKTHAMVAANKAADISIQKAKEHGVGIVGINHIHTSSGAIGYYARKIAKEGLVSFIFVGTIVTVAADGSYEPIFGTNPLAIAVPTEAEPLVFDMSTAAITYFGVVEANTARRALPEGIAYDKEGNLTTDPAKVLDDGAIRTFDQGHKGSGLAMMTQILAGPLVGAAFTGIGDIANNWGHLVVAVDPEILGGLGQVKKGVTQMIEKVKATKKLPGEEVLVPSERGNKMTEEVLAAGEIDIEDNLYNELKKVAERQ